MTDWQRVIRSEPDFEVTDQETIQETTGDYLELLERMVKQGSQRNDPTLAVAISIEALGRLVAEVRASRIRRSSV